VCDFRSRFFAVGRTDFFFVACLGSPFPFKSPSSYGEWDGRDGDIRGAPNRARCGWKRGMRRGGGGVSEKRTRGFMRRYVRTPTGRGILWGRLLWLKLTSPPSPFTSLLPTTAPTAGGSQCARRARQERGDKKNFQGGGATKQLCLPERPWRTGKENPRAPPSILLFWPQDGKQFPETQILLSLGCVGQ
jgi:hypothetical protein